MRNMSTPVFTSGKLRLMVPHISRCGANLEEMLGEAARVGDVLDAKELFGKFALDAIASSSFGIESNSFKDPDSLFRINALKLTRYLILRSWLSTIDDCFFCHFRDPKYAKITDLPKFIFMFIAPRIALKLGMNFFDKKTASFFVDIVRRTIQHRRYDFPYTLTISNINKSFSEKLESEEMMLSIFSWMSLTRMMRKYSLRKCSSLDSCQHPSFFSLQVMHTFLHIFFIVFIVYPIDSLFKDLTPPLPP